jgi:hypothetical protein
MAILEADLEDTPQVWSQVLQLESGFLSDRIDLKGSHNHVGLSERLLLVQVNDMWEQQAHVQAVVGPGATHRTQNVEPRRQRVSGCLVEEKLIADSLTCTRLVSSGASTTSPASVT